MIVRFCFSVLQITAVLCLDCMACGPQTDAGTQDSAISKLIAWQAVPALGESRDCDLPYFPIESTTRAVRGKIASSSGGPVTSGKTDDSGSPQEDVGLVTFGNISPRPAANSEAELFRHLDYSVLTPEYAFTLNAPSPLLKFRTSDSHTLSDKVDSAQFTKIAEAALTSAEMHDDTPQGSTSGSDHSLESIVNRPLSAISLGAAMTPVTSTGEPLQTPQGVVEIEGSRMVQRQHVAGPFCFTHPSRNTFAFRHQPLYFEDPNMERCGLSDGCLTEFTSICHFGVRIPLLPYLMASNSPHECVRALPDCPTCCQFGPDAYIPEPTPKAVAAQAAATVGFIFLIP